VGYRGKVEEQAKARELRAHGLTLLDIATQLGVSKSSVSVWVRDVDFEPRARRTGARRRAPNKLQLAKEAEIAGALEVGRQRIGLLTERELLVAGDESRLRVKLYLHHGLDLDAAVSFWSDLTGIPASQFGKAYRAVPDPSIRTAKHVYGCPQIAYRSVAVHRSVMGLVHALLSSPGVLPG
jgi:transcriptional regulator with XRE-family HTH domain